MLVNQLQFGEQTLVEILWSDSLKPTPGFHEQNADRKADHRTSQLSGSDVRFSKDPGIQAEYGREESPTSAEARDNRRHTDEEAK